MTALLIRLDGDFGRLAALPLSADPVFEAHDALCHGLARLTRGWLGAAGGVATELRYCSGALVRFRNASWN